MDILIRDIDSSTSIVGPDQEANLRLDNTGQLLTIVGPDQETNLRLDTTDQSLVIAGAVQETNLRLDTTDQSLVIAGAVQGIPGPEGDPGATGPQGEQGPPGDAGVTNLSVRNMDTVSLRKCTLVSLINDTDVVRSDINSNYNIIGFVGSDSIGVGSYGNVQIGGILTATVGDWEDATDVLGNLIIGKYYAKNVAGKITRTPNINENVIQVGKAVSGTSIYIDIEPPILKG